MELALYKINILLLLLLNAAGRTRVFVGLAVSKCDDPAKKVIFLCTYKGKFLMAKIITCGNYAK